LAWSAKKEKTIKKNKDATENTMKTFLKIFGGFILLLAIIGLFLDNKINVSRQVEINASPERVHELVNNLNNWPQWSPWKTLDPSIKTTIGDISSGVGASQSWVGESGGGKLIFTQSSADTGIVYDLNFEGDSATYVSGMTYQEKDGKTLVVWYMKGEMGPIIIGNYFAQLMDTLVGDSFQLGLDKLKEVAEKP